MSAADRHQHPSGSDDVRALAARLGELERRARTLEPGRRERNDFTGAYTGVIERFIESLPDQKAYTGGDCRRLRAMCMEETGKPIGDLLGVLEEEVVHFGINSPSGAGFAYIPGGGVWASAAADAIAAATNRYAGVYFASPGAVIIENQMIRWLCSLVGYPESAHGNLTSGGSIANLAAIQAARDSFRIGSADVRKSVVYATQHVHHCIPKALHTTGLDEAQHRIVPMDAQFRMDVPALASLMADDVRNGLRPFLVVATAGTTDTGAVDPLEPIADLCKEYRAWFHVDAAYGGFFLLVDGMKEKFKGIERSDSVVLDPHKGLFLPFGTGAVLVKSAPALIESYTHDAAYMQDAAGYEEISPADCGPELTRHFRGLRMWLPLHLHGLAAFRANLEEKILLCRYFAGAVGRLGFETGPGPELSVAIFRYPCAERDAFNKKILAAVQEDGRCLFSSTTIHGEFWIRCAVLNFRSHLREIQLSVRVLQETLSTLS